MNGRRTPNKSKTEFNNKKQHNRNQKENPESVRYPAPCTLITYIYKSSSLITESCQNIPCRYKNPVFSLNTHFYHLSWYQLKIFYYYKKISFRTDLNFLPYFLPPFFPQQWKSRRRARAGVTPCSSVQNRTGG